MDELDFAIDQEPEDIENMEYPVPSMLGQEGIIPVASIPSLPIISVVGDYHIVEIPFQVSKDGIVGLVVKRFKIKTSSLVNELHSQVNSDKIPVLESTLKRLRELSGISHPKNYI